MPNHIQNEIELVDSNAYDAVVQTCVVEKDEFDNNLPTGEKIKSFDFNALIPMPAHQPDLTKPNPFWKGDVSSETEEAFGKSRTGLDWSRFNWGTKWNAYRLELLPDHHIIRFQTAWSCPDPIVKAFRGRFPDVTWTWKYADEDIGNINCGWWLNTKTTLEHKDVPEQEPEQERKQWEMDLFGLTDEE